MGAAFSIEYGILIYVSVIGVIASYILHRKTKLVSAVFILIGFLLAIIPSIIIYLASKFSMPAEFLEALRLMSLASGPIIVTGFIVFAIKFNNR